MMMMWRPTSAGDEKLLQQRLARHEPHRGLQKHIVITMLQTRPI
jgi:hypothetical protein